MISSSLLKLKPVARWTRLPPPFVPFRSLCSSSSPTFGGDSKTKDDVEEDRKAKDLRTHEVLSKLRSGVLFIKTSLMVNGIVVDRGFGTGFALSKTKGFSAAHVVCGIYPCEVDGVTSSKYITYNVRAKLPGGAFREVTVSAVDTMHDVACLTLPEGMITDCCEMSDELPRLGDTLFYIGNPTFSFCLKSGVFSAMRGVAEIEHCGQQGVLFDSRSFSGEKYIEIDSQGATDGVSGAPLIHLNANGRIIGIIGMVVAGSDVAKCALATPISWLKKLLIWEKSKKIDSVYKYGELLETTEEDDEDWEEGEYEEGEGEEEEFEG